MASIASHLSLSPSTKQTASSTTLKLNTNSSHLHCFQSSKFLSLRYSLDLNQKCVSVSRADHGRSLSVRANSTQDMDQFTTEAEHGVSMTVEVNLGIPSYRCESYLDNWSYPVYIGSGLLDKPELLQRHLHGKKVIVFTNNTIAPLYLDKVVDALTRGDPNISVENVILPDGEQYKDLEILRKVAWGKAPKLDEPATYVALGGGVIADMCSYECSCYENVHFIQIPTTVMAQVDSSVGGNTEINDSLDYSLLKKNFTLQSTAFCPPHGVLIDTDTLNTLPDRELASGFAEVIKYGLIRDAQFFEWLEKNMQALMARDPSALAYAIKRSCENKAAVVSLDEDESGLNLGHTFGFAIETTLGDGQWLHGEVVAAGTVMAVDLSHRLGWIDDTVVQRVHAILKQANLPTAPPENMTLDMFKWLMVGDEVNELQRLVLLRGPPGNCVFTGDHDRKALEATLHKFCKS